MIRKLKSDYKPRKGRLMEEVFDPEWEDFYRRCQSNPVYKRIKLAVLGTPYECPEVIYWDSTYLSFAIRPTNSKLPTIHYDSTKRPKLSLEIPGCYISGYENINDYYNGIVAATNIISSLAELPLDELEHA